MPKFEVDVPHSLSPDEVRARLEKASPKLEKEYGATCRWENEQTLVVSRKGLNARVNVEPTRLHVNVDLGFLLSAMSGSIRSGITKQLTELMSTPPA